MKKNFLAVLFALALCSPTFAQWKPAGDKIKTPWGEQLNPKNVLPEYPRPIMERQDWKNLNGSWNYAITKKGEPAPSNYQGEILVPFAVESSLSGVGKTVNEHQELWYQRTFDVPSAWKGKQILLHFGAVDWKADVWVNDVKVGQHTGGFTPFYFDITSALNKASRKTGRNLVYTSHRYLADCMAGTGSCPAYRPTENNSGYRQEDRQSGSSYQRMFSGQSGSESIRRQKPRSQRSSAQWRTGRINNAGRR